MLVRSDRHQRPVGVYRTASPRILPHRHGRQEEVGSEDAICPSSMATRLAEDVPDIAAALLLSTLFAGLAVVVSTGRTREVDETLRRRQSHPRRGVRRRVARVVRYVAPPKVQLPLAAVLTLLLRRARLPAANAPLTAAAIAFLVERACKRFVRRRRPRRYTGNEIYESFPSGHTAATAALTLTLARLLEREGIVRPPLASAAALALTAFVGETRLILDEHWPSDVLAGGLLGDAAASAALALVGAGARSRGQQHPRGCNAPARRGER
jgi:membrane-associated phospholipid phosphatase